PAVGTTNGAKAASAGATPARGAATGGAVGSTKAASTSKATPPVTVKTRTAASESHKHTQAPPVAKAVPAKTAAYPCGTQTVVPNLKPRIPRHPHFRRAKRPAPRGLPARQPQPKRQERRMSVGSSQPCLGRVRGTVGAWAAMLSGQWLTKPCSI